jgi:Copper binding periplasmic protein CusF
VTSTPRGRSSAAGSAAAGPSADLPEPPALRRAVDPRRVRWLLAALFLGLLTLFAAGLWGTIIRPTAYEVTGQFVARPAANLILIRHDRIEALGMSAMELMAVFGDPPQIDAAGLTPGDRVRLAVRSVDNQLTLVRVVKIP